MLGVIEIPFQADPIRAFAACVFLIAFGFALAILYGIIVNKRPWPDMILALSGVLFCLAGALGNIIRRTQHVWFNDLVIYPLLIALTAAVLLIIGFTGRNSKRGDKINN